MLLLIKIGKNQHDAGLLGGIWQVDSIFKLGNGGIDIAAGNLADSQLGARILNIGIYFQGSVEHLCAACVIASLQIGAPKHV